MANPRPRTVTLACLWAGIGAGFMALSLFLALQNWGSTQIQDVIAEQLDALNLSGITVDDALAWGRWVLTFVLVLAIAAVVFAIHTAKGHRPSRIALTILTAGASVTFFFAGLSGIIPALACVMVLVLLWNREARVWFAPESTAASISASPASPPSTFQPTQSQLPAQQPPAQQSPAQPPTYPGSALPVYGAPVQGAPGQPTEAPRARPGMVTAGLITTLVATLLAMALCALMVLASFLAGDMLADEIAKDQTVMSMLDDTGWTVDQVVVGLGVASALGIGWGLFGLVAVFLAFRRSLVGRILLIIASVLTSVLGVIMFPAGLVLTAIAIFVVVSMSGRPASAWFNQPR